MIVDYIQPDKLPHLIVWLDWNFYAHRMAFFISIIVLNSHYVGASSSISYGGATVASFVGICVWCVYCYIIQGYGVG